MARSIQLKQHHTSDELGEAYRAEDKSLRARQIQVIWMVSRGISTKDIQAATGLSASWVYTLCRRYNEEGLAGLQDRRAGNGGHQRLLNDAQLDELRVLLTTPPPGGGSWTSPKVAAWMSERLDREVNFKVAWRYLKRLGFPLPRGRGAPAGSRSGS